MVDAVVVTGLATDISRRNLANAVAVVQGDAVRQVTSQSVEHALQGKVLGAYIQTNSGAPGGGAQVRMRGITSINATASPLWVIDGIIVSDVSIPSNQNVVSGASSGNNPALTQDGQVNRIVDINPEDIESIEVLKGASASAIIWLEGLERRDHRHDEAWNRRCTKAQRPSAVRLLRPFQQAGLPHVRDGCRV